MPKTNRTSPDAYEVAIGGLIPIQFGSQPATWVTYRPTLYTGLFYAGLTNTIQPLLNAQHIAVTGMSDYLLHGALLGLASAMAKVAEHMTRPHPGPDAVGAARNDRGVRLCNLFLAVTGILIAMLTTTGLQWGGHLVAVTLMATATAGSELCWRFYGKKHPIVQPPPTPRGRASSKTARAA